MGWLWLVGSIKLQVFFAKEPYKTDDILQKKPIILSILLTVATPQQERYQLDLQKTPRTLQKIISKIPTKET